MLSQIFLEHPRSVGETYLAHQRRAFRFGLSMILGGLACLVHGLVPALFLRTGSTTVSHLYQRIVMSRADNGNGSANALPTR